MENNKETGLFKLIKERVKKENNFSRKTSRL